MNKAWAEDEWINTTSLQPLVKQRIIGRYCCFGTSLSGKPEYEDIPMIYWGNWKFTRLNTQQVEVPHYWKPIRWELDDE